MSEWESGPRVKCPLLTICISHFRPYSILGHVVKFVWQTEIKCTVLTSKTVGGMWGEEFMLP